MIPLGRRIDLSANWFSKYEFLEDFVWHEMDTNAFSSTTPLIVLGIIKLPESFFFLWEFVDEDLPAFFTKDYHGNFFQLFLVGDKLF